MEITRKSMLTGKVRTKDLAITEQQINAWQSQGLLIQDAFPDLSADDREFLMTGITTEEWDAAFKEPVDE